MTESESQTTSHNHYAKNVSVWVGRNSCHNFTLNYSEIQMFNPRTKGTQNVRRYFRGSTMIFNLDNSGAKITFEITSDMLRYEQIFRINVTFSPLFLVRQAYRIWYVTIYKNTEEGYLRAAIVCLCKRPFLAGLKSPTGNPRFGRRLRENTF